jgi:hypothetical protein
VCVCLTFDCTQYTINLLCIYWLSHNCPKFVLAKDAEIVGNLFNALCLLLLRGGKNKNVDIDVRSVDSIICFVFQVE